MSASVTTAPTGIASTCRESLVFQLFARTRTPSLHAVFILKIWGLDTPLLERRISDCFKRVEGASQTWRIIIGSRIRPFQWCQDRPSNFIHPLKIRANVVVLILCAEFFDTSASSMRIEVQQLVKSVSFFSRSSYCNILFTILNP
jgi:hypothetical protein